jgi:hypothetical protein
LTAAQRTVNVTYSSGIIANSLTAINTFLDTLEAPTVPADYITSFTASDAANTDIDFADLLTEPSNVVINQAGDKVTLTFEEIDIDVSTVTTGSSPVTKSYSVLFKIIVADVPLSEYLALYKLQNYTDEQKTISITYVDDATDTQADTITDILSGIATRLAVLDGALTNTYTVTLVTAGSLNYSESYVSSNSDETKLDLYYFGVEFNVAISSGGTYKATFDIVLRDLDKAHLFLIV